MASFKTFFGNEWMHSILQERMLAFLWCDAELLGKHLFVQTEQYKQQKKAWNKFKVNNKTPERP